jgi:hypothetical protein
MLPLLAVLPLLVSTRSLMTYFAYVPLLLIVSIGANRDGGAWASAARGDAARRVARLIAWGGGVAVAACIVGFMAAHAPMQIRLTEQRRTVAAGGHETVSLIVTARNDTGRPIRPYLTLSTGQTTNPAFGAVSGPAVLSPHTTATYRIEAVDENALLARGDNFVIEAFSADPASLSTSPPYTAT